MVEIKIFVEGGGNTNPLRTRCRRGFSSFILNAGLEGRMPRVVACGSRQEAYDDFCTALRQARPNEFPMLLVDSEEPVVPGKTNWEHLRDRPDDRWQTPHHATEEHCHLMVQCMEAWFLADKDTLEAFYGQGFRSSSLPVKKEVEDIPKNEVMQGLHRATGVTKTKGLYHKASHSFEILALIDPEKVQAVAPHAKQWIDVLKEKTGISTD